MTKKEIIKKIEELENKVFYLKMKDRWTGRDYFTMDRLQGEIKELRKNFAIA
jgi:ribosomal protein L29